MLNWLHQDKKERVEQAAARARERAGEAPNEDLGGYDLPSQDGLEVEEISPEEFMRLMHAQTRAA